jgi:hypothetical protein
MVVIIDILCVTVGGLMFAAGMDDSIYLPKWLEILLIVLGIILIRLIPGMGAYSG